MNGLDFQSITTIHWRINGYNTRTNVVLEESQPIGCCHDVGVEVKQRICGRVLHSDLILGRPWEWSVRAQYINEDNGSYIVVI